MEQWKKVTWSNKSCFLLHQENSQVQASFFATSGCSMGKGQAGKGSVIALGMLC